MPEKQQNPKHDEHARGTKTGAKDANIDEEDDAQATVEGLGGSDTQRQSGSASEEKE